MSHPVALALDHDFKLVERLVHPDAPRPYVDQVERLGRVGGLGKGDSGIGRSDGRAPGGHGHRVEGVEEVLRALDHLDLGGRQSRLVMLDRVAHRGLFGQIQEMDRHGRVGEGLLDRVDVEPSLPLEELEGIHDLELQGDIGGGLGLPEGLNPGRELRHPLHLVKDENMLGAFQALQSGREIDQPLLADPAQGFQPIQVFRVEPQLFLQRNLEDRIGGQRDGPDHGVDDGAVLRGAHDGVGPDPAAQLRLHLVGRHVPDRGLGQAVALHRRDDDQRVAGLEDAAEEDIQGLVHFGQPLEHLEQQHEDAGAGGALRRGRIDPRRDRVLALQVDRLHRLQDAVVIDLEIRSRQMIHEGGSLIDADGNLHVGDRDLVLDVGDGLWDLLRAGRGDQDKDGGESGDQGMAIGHGVDLPFPGTE